MLLTYLWILVLIHIIFTWYAAIRRGVQARRRLSPAAQPGSFNLPPVSILVPAWREKGTIEKCMEALKKIDYPNWEALILAGGEDGTFKAAVQAAEGDERFRVLERGPEPKNVAINRGIQSARFDIFVILDADSIVFPDWLSKLVQPLLAGESASYGFYLPSKWTWISMEENMLQIQYHIENFPMFPGCASVAIRREAMEKIGPLTTDAYSWEDYDVYAKLVDIGGRIIPVPGAKLVSDRPTTFQEFWAVNMRAFRTHLAGLWHHRDVFIQRPLKAIYELFFLGFGAILSLAVIAGLIAIIARPALFPAIGKVALLIAVWIIGRRAAIGAEIRAFTGELKWLRRAWSPVVLLLVQIPAALVAVLTVRHQPSFDYKGRREVNVN